MDNEYAHKRFVDLIEREHKVDPDFDIRAHVLSLRSRTVGMGLTDHVLTRGFGANLNRLFPHIVPVDSPLFPDCDAFVAHGTIHEDPTKSHNAGRTLFNLMPKGERPLLIETSFLATSHSWLHSRRDNNPNFACLGYVYDDIAHYFMADHPNRLIHRLNGDKGLSDDEEARATALIERIVSARISKYNAQPMTPPTPRPGFSRRVLVCDQTYGDASTIYGRVGEPEFEAMLKAALDENPDAEIFVKTHPDTAWKGAFRTGFYNHMQSEGRITILRDPINPYALFDLVDTVYVGTSQMGFEALLAGKKVVTFGAPFYAGWGLTDDRQTIPHRHRTRTLTEIFHSFYIWYTIFHVPGVEGVATIEDALDHIETHRPYPYFGPSAASEEPKVSVIVPVYNVEKYLEECLTSVTSQTLRDIEIIPVNDATPDGSKAIIDRFAASDARVRPLHLEQNIGLGFVRNAGIAAARGKYVWFLDGDDWLSHDDCLRQLYERAEADDLDMLRARNAKEVIFAPDDSVLQERPDSGEAAFDREIRRTTYAESPVILNNRHCWVWLYRRDFLVDHEVKFVTRQWEERAFLVQALTNARSIGLSTIEGPAYRIRAGSISRTAKSERDIELIFQNFRHSFGTLIECGAVDRDSPLREHLEHHVTQYLVGTLFATPYRAARNKGEEAKRAFLAGIEEDLDRLDFRPSDFNPQAIGKNSAHRYAQSGRFAVAALQTGNLALLQMAVDLVPVPQSVLYDELLKEPRTEAEAELQFALSRYARNEQAARDRTVGAPRHRPRIILHIGASKTGSTYIQHTLENNRAALLRDGVWFPEVGLFWQREREHKQGGHAPFTGEAQRKNGELREYIDAGLALLGDRIHTIILSSEAFFLVRQTYELAEYFEGHPIEVVVYLRRQDEWANSQYCEFVAGGAAGRTDETIESWLSRGMTKRWLDYKGMLALWSDTIGAENIHVRRFDALHEGDLLLDFAQATGIAAIAGLPRPDRGERNEARLSAAHVEAIRHYNARTFRTREDYYQFIEEVGAAITSWRAENGIPVAKPWVLTDAQSKEIMASQAANNAAVARDYLGRTDGVLFDDTDRAHEPSAIYHEELQIIEDIFQRHAPTPEEKARLRKAEAQQRLMNYGIFGWRLWLLTPVFAAVYARFTTQERIEEFRREPARYAQIHWAERRPMFAALLYPQGDVMGPGGVFRLWLPVARRMIARLNRPDMQDSFEEAPIEFARRMRHPLRRAIGRVMFPLGELRG